MIYIPYRITRKFIQHHHEWNFVYGSVFSNHIVRELTQAYEARGEPNAFYVPTRHLACTCAENKWNDYNFTLWKKLFQMETLDELPRDKPIVVFPKIGQGGAALNKSAPKIYAYMCEILDGLKSKDIVIDPMMEPMI